MTLVLTAAEVRELLPMATCIDLVAEALRVLARGEAVNPLRVGMPLPDRRGLLGTMPGYLGSPEALGIKVVTVFPGNHGTRYDAHQGVVLLFEPEHGVPAAIMDASEITAIRTAAATGVATRLLAREDAKVLAILGSGVQAGPHLHAMAAVRPLREIRVFSPHPANRDAFVTRHARDTSVTVIASPTAEAAVRDADIVCTVTSASEPVVRREWLTAGTHINAVGSSVRWTREIDSDTVADSRLYVDRRESTVNEAGDYLKPLKEGRITEDHIVGEIGDVLEGRVAGRGSPEELTLFKSLGLAVEDLVAADHVYRRARELGVGTIVALGGVRDPAD